MARPTPRRATRGGAGARKLYDWLAAQQMPVTVTGAEEVATLRNMVAAGLIRADIPPPILRPDKNGVEQPPAVVLALTSTGRQWRAK